MPGAVREGAEGTEQEGEESVNVREILMKSTLLTVVSILILSSASLGTAQTLQEMEVIDHGIATVVVRNPDIGILIVESVIPELSFESNMGIIEVTHERPGEWILHLYPGTNLITFKAEGYKALSDMRLVVPKKRARKVEVKPLKIVGTEIPIAVITKPEGAEIFIDKENRGTGKGHTVSVGTYHLRIVKDGYQAIEETIDVDAEHTIFEYTLEKIEDVGLEITTVPDSATIYIDGVKVGLSPVGTFYLPGKYPIRIERAWYVVYEDSIEIHPPETKKEYVLQPDFGEITVTSSPQSDLNIYVNGVDRHLKTPHTFFRQRPGTYKIRARSQYYETKEREVQLKRGEKKSVRLTSEENFATLTIHTYDHAAVYLNGERIRRLKDIRLEPMIATVEVRMPKAEPLTERITLKKGETRSLDLYPEVQTGSIQVTVKPLDARVELSGDAGEHYASQGKGYFKDIPIGKYALAVTMDEYEPHTETVSLKAGEKIRRSVVLQRGGMPPVSRAEIARKKPFYKMWWFWTGVGLVGGAGAYYATQGEEEGGKIIIEW